MRVVLAFSWPCMDREEDRDISAVSLPMQLPMRWLITVQGISGSGARHHARYSTMLTHRCVQYNISRTLGSLRYSLLCTSDIEPKIDTVISCDCWNSALT